MEDSKVGGEETDDLDEDMEDSKGLGEEIVDMHEHMEDTEGTKEDEGCKLLVHQAGGNEFVGFTRKDLYNKLKAHKDSILLDGDAQASITFMNMSALQDPHFYCLYSADEHGRLANMFWRDGQSLSDYTNFGDVLIFDSTYKSNIYDKPLAVFVGVNNHRGTVLFGCALLVDESEETYNWVLNAFLTSMRGKKPLSVITDGDDAMRNAVCSLLPEARHRLCAWHIGKNVCQHLKEEDTRKEFFHLIFGGFTIEEWELAWQYFVAMNGLENDSWVSSMYNKRERWAEAFFRDHFFTYDVFLLIQDQIKYENKFVISHREVDLHNTYQSISVTQFGKPQRLWNVLYQPHESNPRFLCSCKLFESDGIPCCHIFLVMKTEMITNFPDSLVHPRWKKDAGQNKVSIPNGSADDKSMRIARYGELMGICSRLCHLACYSEDGYAETREALRQLTLKSEKFKAVTADPDDAVTFEGSHPNVIRDPVVCKTKGVQSKANIPGNEENYKSKVGKACKMCHMPGHNSRTCPKLKNDNGKQATQKNRGKVCGKHAAENRASDYKTSDSSHCRKEPRNRPKRKVPNLIHNVEEARPLEFFTGYEESNDLERSSTSSTSSTLPDFFEHYRPFPDDI